MQCSGRLRSLLLPPLSLAETEYSVHNCIMCASCSSCEKQPLRGLKETRIKVNLMYSKQCISCMYEIVFTNINENIELYERNPHEFR